MPNNKETIRLDEIQDSVEGQSVSIQRLSTAIKQVGDRVEQMASRITSKLNSKRTDTSERVLSRAEGRTAAQDEGQARAQTIDTKERLLQDRDDRHGRREESISGLMGGKLSKEGRDKLRQVLGSNSSQARDLRTQGEGELRNLKQQREETQKRLLAVREERKHNEDKLLKNKEILKGAKETDSLERAAKTRHDHEKKSGGGGAEPPKGGGGGGDEDGGDGRRRRSRYGMSPLEVLSDLHIPGLSHLATAAKYAKMGGAAGAEAMGGEGLMGSIGGIGGTVGGLALGAGVAYGGMVGVQGFRAYRKAHEMSPERQRLMGLLGPGGERNSRGTVTSDELAGLGYGGMENMRDLGTLSRQIGGVGATGNLVKVSQLARGYGMDRSEVGGQAESLMMAGGAKDGASSVESLQRVLATGVAAGMDRARITHFTQQVVGLQEQVLQITGENKVSEISDAIGRLYAAGGRGESFFKGPEMGAIRGIDSAMKSGSRSMSGPGTATMLRALGFGAGSNGKRSSGDEYYDAAREMEGGLFGGGGRGAIGRVRKIVGQFTSESGGNEKVANLRMQQELGLGIRQIEKLRTLLSKEQAMGGLSKGDDAELKAILEGQKDPIVELQAISARNESHLMRLADDISPELVSIDRALQRLQEELNGDVKSIVNIVRKIADSSVGKGAMDMASGMDWKDMALAAGGAVIALKTLAGVMGGATGTIGSLVAGLGGLSTILAAMPGVGLAIATGAAISDLPDAFNNNAKFKDDLAERTKGRGFLGNVAHLGDTIEATGTMLGEMVTPDSYGINKKIMGDRQFASDHVSDTARRLEASGRKDDAAKYLGAYKDSKNKTAIPSMKALGLAPLAPDSGGGLGVGEGPVSPPDAKSTSVAPPTVAKADSDIKAEDEMRAKRKADAADVSGLDKKNVTMEQLRAMRLLTLAVEENTEAVSSRTSGVRAPGGRVR